MLTRTYTVLFIFLFASCNTEDNQSDTNPTSSVPAPQPITFSIVSVLPHDTTAFTQGLQFYNGKLYEGTGEFKNSTLRIVDPKTGKVEKNI
ncbi:MAG: glutaminyl-peptide cyclotransferase [Chitinophagaceae bacterium]